MFLGIDYGRARIGIAVSDSGIQSRPFCTIKNKGSAKNIAAIKELLIKYSKTGVNTADCRIVCGVPLDIEGGETDMSREIRKFGEILGASLNMEVLYHNERYTSIEAEHYIHATKSKDSVDAVAAAVILQNYLDNIKEQS